MRAIGHPRHLAPAIVSAVLWFATPALAQEVAQSCANVAASHWEIGHRDATQDLEGFDTAEVIATCEPELKAKPDDIEIKAWLGHAYFHDGRIEEALKLLVDAARAGSPVAQFIMSDVYRDGTGGTTPDPQQSLTMLTAAAGQGFAPAQLGLGDTYRWGDDLRGRISPRHASGTARRRSRGWGRLKPGSAAPIITISAMALSPTMRSPIATTRSPPTRRIRTAFTEWACFTMRGLGVAADRSRAFDYFTQAADLGQVQGAGDVGAAYLNGDDFVDVDYAKALGYFQRGAEQEDAFSLSTLAYMYENGLGIEQELCAGRIALRACRLARQRLFTGRTWLPLSAGAWRRAGLCEGRGVLPAGCRPRRRLRAGWARLPLPGRLSASRRTRSGRQSCSSRQQTRAMPMPS